MLTGRVALITGAGGGIGAATARRFASEGILLVLTDVNAERLDETVRSLGNHETLAQPCDLTDEDAVRALVAGALGRFGKLEIAINAAGVLRQTRLEEISKQEWDRVVDVNLGATFLVCRECAAPMRAQSWGRIVNFSSLAGQVGGILAGAHYSAAKAGVISLTRSVAKLLAPYGVRCNAVAPAGVETDMLWCFTPEQQATLLSGIPAGRFGTPDELAELVLWLSSPATDFLTGQTISFNGGAYFS
jgi:3-oxoacyl-[acyl-carrier protein] reductase